MSLVPQIRRSHEEVDTGFVSVGLSLSSSDDSPGVLFCEFTLAVFLSMY